MTDEIDANEGEEASNDRPSITQQYSFAVGEDGEIDGEIEPVEETVETDLETWGADVDHRECDSRIDQPEATSFGVDDRATVTRGDAGEQGALFAQADDDQQTLTGERAASQCLFETDDGDHSETDEPTTDEPAASATDSNDGTTTTRAVVTDGGHPANSEDEGEGNEGGEDENKPIRTEKVCFACGGSFTGRQCDCSTGVEEL